jgi:DNA-binding HxlR family transcriptional regulator
MRSVLWGRIETRLLPAYEVPRVEASLTAEEPTLANAVLDMKALAQTPDERLTTALTPLVDGYEAWLTRQATRVLELNRQRAEEERLLAVEEEKGPSRPRAKRGKKPPGGPSVLF